MGRFIGNLDARLIDETNKISTWMLLAPLTYVSTDIGVQVTADTGFITDFCSVPRVPLAYWLLGNCAQKAGAIHDWVYRYKILPRIECDLLLKEMVIVCGLNEFEAQEFFIAVRNGGRSHYGR